MTVDEEFMKKTNNACKCKGISTINIVIENGGICPTRSHELDAGLDIYSPEDVVLWGHDCKMIDSRVRVEIPAGYVGKMCSRSSMFKRNTLVDGTIDAGYTGTIGIQIQNHNSERILINKGDKIAQLIIQPIETPILNIVDKLDATERGDNGFGSTGR